MGGGRTDQPCRIGDIVSGFVERLDPIRLRHDSVAEVWSGLLPRNLRAHCRVAALSGGCLRVVTDSCSYMYELQLCKAELLGELQRLCPAARIRRIEVGMGR
jgi:hypothetical protein